MSDVSNIYINVGNKLLFDNNSIVVRLRFQPSSVMKMFAEGLYGHIVKLTLLLKY